MYVLSDVIFINKFTSLTVEAVQDSVDYAMYTSCNSAFSIDSVNSDM